MRKTLGNSRKGSRSLIAFEIVQAYGCLCPSQSGDRRLIRIPSVSIPQGTALIRTLIITCRHES